MRFERKAHFGLLGETLIADLIRFQKEKDFKGEIEVRINTGPGLVNGYGIRYHSSDGTSEVIPDIEIVRRPDFKPAKTEFAEIKTKSAFCAWLNDKPGKSVNWRDYDWEIRTGINIKDWEHYCWYWQKHYHAPLWLVFVHPMNVIQLRNNFGVCVPGLSGIYRAELGQLFDLAKHGTGKQFGAMIYWPINNLTLWRAGEQAAVEQASRNVWRDLECEAAKHSKRIELITLETSFSIAA